MTVDEFVEHALDFVVGQRVCAWPGMLLTRHQRELASEAFEQEEPADDDHQGAGGSGDRACSKRPGREHGAGERAERYGRTRRASGTVAAFEQAIASIPHVLQAQRLLGDPDYLLRTVTTDLAAYQQLYDHQLSALPGVRRLTSTIVMKDVVSHRPLPQ